MKYKSLYFALKTAAILSGNSVEGFFLILTPSKQLSGTPENIRKKTLIFLTEIKHTLWLYTDLVEPKSN